jgi:hypothetical protein
MLTVCVADAGEMMKSSTSHATVGYHKIHEPL